MFHKGRQRNLQRARQLPDAGRTRAEARDDPASSGICQSRKHRVELIRLNLMISHKAKYYTLLA